MWGFHDKIVKLNNLLGELLRSVQTKSGVTKSGDLVYTDPDDCTINLESGTKVRRLIRLWRWVSCRCSTSSGDLLITMDSDDYKQRKIVHYNGTKGNQSIQFDDQGRPYYTSNRLFNIKYISEYKTLDICVADSNARALVVFSQQAPL